MGVFFIYFNQFLAVSISQFRESMERTKKNFSSCSWKCDAEVARMSHRCAKQLRRTLGDFPFFSPHPNIRKNREENFDSAARIWWKLLNEQFSEFIRTTILSCSVLVPRRVDESIIPSTSPDCSSALFRLVDDRWLHKTDAFVDDWEARGMLERILFCLQKRAAGTMLPKMFLHEFIVDSNEPCILTLCTKFDVWDDFTFISPPPSFCILSFHLSILHHLLLLLNISLINAPTFGSPHVYFKRFYMSEF